MTVMHSLTVFSQQQVSIAFKYSKPHLSSSMGMFGRGVTSDPVAMMMFLPLTVWLPPSSKATSTSLGPLKLPQPLTYVTYTKTYVKACVNTRKCITDEEKCGICVKSIWQRKACLWQSSLEVEIDLVLFKEPLNSRGESCNSLVFLLHHLRKNDLYIADVNAIVLEVVHSVMILLT